MSKMTPREMARQIGNGLLSFPVTPFHKNYSFNEAQYRANLDWLCGYEVAGLFAAGGTGEFFPCHPPRSKRSFAPRSRKPEGAFQFWPVRATAQRSQRRWRSQQNEPEPTVFCCYRLISRNRNRTALPPTLKQFARPPDWESSSTIATMRLSAKPPCSGLCDKCPNLVGYKDGIGDIELMTRVYCRLGDRLTYIGGLPTAETFALPYLEMGVTTYSSAVFNFVPRFATEFYAAVRRRDRDNVQAGLRDFILPLIAIRNRKKGYAVSMIKAGMKVIGRDSGPTRPPLSDLNAAEMAELASLVERAGKSPVSTRQTTAA